MRKRVAVLLFAVMMMVLAGCGGKSQADSPVVGDWKLATAETMGVTMDVDEYAELVGGDMSFDISVKSDGTFEMALAGETANGNWEYKEPTLTLKSDETVTCEYKDDKLTMELDEATIGVEGGVTFVFEK